MKSIAVCVLSFFAGVFVMSCILFLFTKFMLWLCKKVENILK